MTDLLHVGNFSAALTEPQIHALFAETGNVTQARLMLDAQTGATRGFALVEMATPEESGQAVMALNGKLIDGRALTVRLLPPRAVGWGGGNDKGGSNRSHGLGPGNGGSRW